MCKHAMYVLHTQPFFDPWGAQDRAIVWRLGDPSTTGRLYLIWTWGLDEGGSKPCKGTSGFIKESVQAPLINTTQRLSPGANKHVNTNAIHQSRAVGGGVHREVERVRQTQRALRRAGNCVLSKSFTIKWSTLALGSFLFLLYVSDAQSWAEKKAPRSLHLYTCQVKGQNQYGTGRSWAP